MISTEGMLTVPEAAKRLNRSTEQVRRYLREGKLQGQRVGSQWFVDESALESLADQPRPLVPVELLRRIDRNREAIFKGNGVVYDVVEMLSQDRESH